MAMKRFLIAVMLLTAGCVWAQNPVRDSVPNDDADDMEENVIGGRVMRTNRSQEANVLGAPVYYNRDGSVRTNGVRRSNHPQRDGYQRPRHHYRNTLDNSYCSYFFEVEGMSGSDMAVGVNFTYLPNRWGAYASVLNGYYHDYLSVGPVMRLSDYDYGIDLQLYAGAIFGRHIGGEMGFRMALPQRNGEFCWNSASVGIGIQNGGAFVTAGLSLELSAIVALGSFLFF